MERNNPPAAAVTNDHELEWDPPAGLTSASRWTCRVCGAAALRYERNEYGSAVRDRCSR